MMLQRPDGRIPVYRRNKERFANDCLLQVDRIGRGSDMVWGAIISYNQRTSLVLVPCNLTAQMYRDDFRKPHLPVINTQSWVFQHANTRPHTSHATDDFLADHKVMLPWSSRFPNLNLTENLWINWIKVCACVNQSRKLFCKTAGTTRRKTKNGPGPNSAFNSINADTM